MTNYLARTAIKTVSVPIQTKERCNIGLIFNIEPSSIRYSEPMVPGLMFRFKPGSCVPFIGPGSIFGESK